MRGIFDHWRRKPIEERLDRVSKLPLKSQAICVMTAAEMSSHIWEAWEAANDLPPLAETLKQTFQRWLDGQASEDQLKECGEELLKSLSSDLLQMNHPLAGLAGYALFDVTLIALDRCEDVHWDILCTSIMYAAAAATGTQRPPFKQLAVNCDQLTTAEIGFLEEWWTLCCQKIPVLE